LCSPALDARADGGLDELRDGLPFAEQGFDFVSQLRLDTNGGQGRCLHLQTVMHLRCTAFAYLIGYPLSD